MCRQYVGDAWSDLIADIFTLCKLTWRYALPEEDAERQRLRELCERMLALENHLLEIYRPSLLAWREQEERRDYAEKLLAMIRYPDLEDAPGDNHGR